MAQVSAGLDKTRKPIQLIHTKMLQLLVPMSIEKITSHISDSYCTAESDGVFAQVWLSCLALMLSWQPQAGFRGGSGSEDGSGAAF